MTKTTAGFAESVFDGRRAADKHEIYFRLQALLRQTGQEKVTAVVPSAIN